MKNVISPLGRVSINLFILAVLSFGVGCTVLAVATDSILHSFYGPLNLAVVHLFTLGWITPTIMGVMYRYVPGLTGKSLPLPRVAGFQFLLYSFGVLGMLGHFAVAEWVGLWWSAAIVTLSLVIFAINLFPCLLSTLHKGATQVGMFLAICFLLGAAALGTLLGINETRPILVGDPFSNLAAHVHLAALGWVTLTICAASYRFLTAFILPKETVPRWAVLQIVALAAATLGLVFSLLMASPSLRVWTVMIIACLIAYVLVIARIVQSRRMPIDWATGHVFCAFAWLIVACGLGLLLTDHGVREYQGSKLAVAYGASGLLGWIGNFIVGMSYQLFPGYVTKARSELGWPAMTIGEVSARRFRALTCIALNLGLGSLVVAVLAEMRALARLGSLLEAIAAWVYVGAMLWTLSFAYRRSIPSRVLKNSLRVLP